MFDGVRVSNSVDADYFPSFVRPAMHSAGSQDAIIGWVCCLETAAID